MTDPLSKIYLGQLIEDYERLKARGELMAGDVVKLEGLKERFAMLGARGNEHKSQREEVSHRVKKARQRGTNTERACAKATGGVVVGRSKVVNVPTVGYVQVNCQQPPDVLSPPFFSWECTNQPFPKGVSEKVSQAIRNAPEGFSPYLWWYDPDTRTTYIITIKPVHLELHGK